jgi:predicted phosphoribosyltransferase
MSRRNLTVFENREDAARRLARELPRRLSDPLVLGIPRGGVETAAVIAAELGAELDVILSRKLRAPDQPEYALGAVSESGQLDLNQESVRVTGASAAYIQKESRYQLAENARRKKMIRELRPPAPVAGRSVIVTDDGVATGATMIAALRTARLQQPQELIAAVPVAPPNRVNDIQQYCDTVVCLLAPDDFWAVGQFYRNFEAVQDDDVLRFLRAAEARSARRQTLHRFSES